MSFEGATLACTGAGMGLWWPVGALLSVGLWAGLIWGGVTLARRSGVLRGSRRAEELLAERFATGEIDEDEYHERRRTLRADDARPWRERV